LDRKIAGFSPNVSNFWVLASLWSAFLQQQK